MDTTSSSNKNRPKNIIMIVADGMGPAYPTAYRLYRDDPNTAAVETTIFDKYLVGASSTVPAAVSGYVTDSAASATALAAGVKSYNGAIGVDVDKNPVKSVLTYAKEQGKGIGVAVTSEVNHATPAAYLSHNEYRKNYNALADSYIDNGWKSDVLLGGGTDYFIRDDRNIVAELQQQGIHYVDSYEALASLPNKPVFGLFAPKGLPNAKADSDVRRLTTMVKAMTQHLEDHDNGFFALIEASQVDWAGHANNIAHAMIEMDDLAHTLLYLETFVEQHPETLVVLTADHSTGGLTVAANGAYKWDPSLLRTLDKPLSHIAKQWLSTELTKKALSDLFGTALTDKQYQSLVTAKQSALSAEKPQKAMLTALKQFVDDVTNTGWTTGGHTGIDVPVYAFGHSAEVFIGHQDNTDIADKIFALLGR